MSNFAVADLHGCYKQWRQIQSFCKDSDRIYVLGDCIDRNEDSLKTLKSVLNDPRTTLLCGNHEDMMRQTLIAERDWAFEQDDMALYRWRSNGGSITFDQWQEEGRNFDWISVLQHLPLWAKYTNSEGKNIIMTHSGVTPKIGYDVSSLERKPLLWDRRHINETRWHRDENEIVIHGHTPIVLMPQLKSWSQDEIEPGAFWYCDMHKCNIDNGGCWTGYICLLDLDTWEEHIFNG